MKRKRPLPRKRKKTSTAAQVRPFWVLIVLFAGLVAVALGFGVSWPGFDPKNVAVYGNRQVARGEILARAAIAANRNIWLQNPRAIAQRIEQIPDIERAAVHRIPPGTVMIGVTERAPFAVVLSGDGAAIVDRSLRVLQPASGEVTLPVLRLRAGITLEPGTFVTDPSAAQLRDEYDAMVAAHVVPQMLSFDRFGGLVATMRGGIRVLFGEEDDLSKKLSLVDPILAQVVRNQRRVAAIDLRAPSTPVLVYK